MQNLSETKTGCLEYSLIKEDCLFYDKIIDEAFFKKY